MSEASERFAHAMELYHLRSALFRAVCNLTEEQLRRASGVIARLTPDELDAALGYAEGLAAWSAPAQESGDAQAQATETG